MKLYKHLILSFFAMVCFQTAEAQAEKGAIRLGGELAFGTEIESLGIGVRGDYALTEQILLASDLIYFFGDSNYNWFDINFNGNYLFDINNPVVVLYGLAGFNIAIVSYDVDGFVDGSSTDIGLNLGGGADFLVGNLILFGELRFAISSSDQLVLAGGVKFPLK